MRFILFVALCITCGWSVTGRPTEVEQPQLTRLLERVKIPYCVFPSFRPHRDAFNTQFTTEPIGNARSRFDAPPYQRAGNSLLNYRIYERITGIGGGNTVIDVAAPDGHPALHNYEIEVRRIPVATPNAAGECFRTVRLSAGERGAATLTWHLDSSYIYYLTISSD